MLLLTVSYSVLPGAYSVCFSFPLCVCLFDRGSPLFYQHFRTVFSGEMLGHGRPVRLQILEIPQAMRALEGVAMELSDCAFPLLHSVEITDDPKVAFKNSQFGMLIGAKPRTKGII